MLIAAMLEAGLVLVGMPPLEWSDAARRTADGAQPAEVTRGIEGGAGGCQQPVHDLTVVSGVVESHGVAEFVQQRRGADVRRAAVVEVGVDDGVALDDLDVRLRATGGPPAALPDLTRAAEVARRKPQW